MSWIRLIEEMTENKESRQGAANETSSTEALAPKGPKTQSGAGRLMHLLKDMWPAYLIEVIVIILGISITLGLESWRDENKEKGLEKIYLSNLAADLDADQKSLQIAGSRTEDLVKHGEAILQFISNPAANKITPHQLNSDIRSILGRPKFVIHDATFSDLKSSGNLHLISDLDLKNGLFAYYNQAQIIKETQDAEQEATITLSGPYFLKRFVLSENADSSMVLQTNSVENLGREPEFQNNVMLRVSNRKELLELYRMAGAMASELHQKLTVEK